MLPRPAEVAAPKGVAEKLTDVQGLRLMRAALLPWPTLRCRFPSISRSTLFRPLQLAVGIDWPAAAYPPIPSPLLGHGKYDDDTRLAVHPSSLDAATFFGRQAEFSVLFFFLGHTYEVHSIQRLASELLTNREGLSFTTQGLTAVAGCCIIHPCMCKRNPQALSNRHVILQTCKLHVATRTCLMSIRWTSGLVWYLNHVARAKKTGRSAELNPGQDDCIGRRW